MLLTARILVLCLLASVAACGRQQGIAANATSERRTADTGKQTIDPARFFDGPSCSPPAVMAPGNDPAEPTADIRGLRVATPLDEASRFIECQDPHRKFASEAQTNGLGIQYYGNTVRTFVQVVTGAPKSDDELRKTRPPGISLTTLASGGGGIPGYLTWGFSKVTEQYGLTAVGDPGSEVAYGVSLRQVFEDGSNPTIASIEDGLKAKYGEPQRVEPEGAVWVLYWVRDPSGKVMEKTAPHYRECMVSASATMLLSALDACGVTVSVMISPNQSNDLLARELVVSVIDQAKFVKAAQTAQARWQAADAERKNGEAQRASGAPAPKL